MIGDSLERLGAERLGAMIVDYWWRRGFDCVIRLERSRIRDDNVWLVRSDMIGGMPRRKRNG
jgi:hypothetical protein